VSPGRCPHRSDVDDHFAGRLAVSREQKLRVHLPECPACRDRYARHLKLETIDPRALRFTERMRRGLGLARPAFAGRLLGFGGLGAALALAAVMLLPRAGQPGLTERFAGDGVRARGGEAELPLVLSLDDGTEIAGFRTSGPGAPAPATDRLTAQAELAFTYRNTGGWSHLMVFARDARGEVYWFYPQWTDPASDPAGVALATGTERHELPAAVAHQFGGNKLALCALVSRAPVSVRQIEAGLSAAPPEALAGPDRAVTCREVEVVP
jgi:hypothetical protein